MTEVLKKAPQPASALSWALTAGALFLVWVGEHVSLPGLSPDPMAGAVARVRAESLTVFSLGVTPILTSWFIVELLRVTPRSAALARAA